MKLSLWIVTGIVLLTVPCFAAKKAYTLNDCFSLAVSRSEALADQKELVQQAEEHYNQAVGALFPTVVGAASYGIQHIRAGAMVPDQATLKVSASQSLFRGFRLENAVSQNKFLWDAQQKAARWVGMQLYSDVSQAFYLLRYLQEDRRLLDEELHLYDQRIAELRDRIRIGRSRDTEVLTVQVSRAVLNAQIAQGELQIQSAKSLLAFLTGVDVVFSISEAPVLSDSLSPLPMYLSKISHRPDLQAAQARVQSAKVGVDIAIAARDLPSVDVLGNYYLLHSGTQTDTDVDAQLQITLPNFVGTVAQSKATESASVLHQAEVDAQLLRRQTGETITELYQTLKSELTQAALLDQAVSYADRNAKSVISDYRLGLDTNLDALQALNSYIEAKRSLNKSRYAFKTDLAKMNYLTAEVPQ